MNVLTIAARVLLGLAFFASGIIGVFDLLGLFEPPSGKPLVPVWVGLQASGYFFYLLAAVYLVAGVMLMSEFFVPLALLVLAPIIVNIILLHLAIDLAGIPPALVVLVLEGFLAWRWWGSFRGVLEMRARPGRDYPRGARR